MHKLPAYGKFRCLICHTTSAPVAGDAPLNSFGEDFRNNGNVWDRALALKNSDGDKCLNGFELGDANGDGILEEVGGREHSNPGDPRDCSIALSYRTWGIIKEIFKGE